MHMLYTIYKTLITGLFILLLPGFWIYTCISNNQKKGLNEPLGSIPGSLIDKLTGSPRIWIHAASLGEIKVADAVIESLRRSDPSCAIIISTITESGHNMARKIFNDHIPVIYAPVDLASSVRRSLRTIQP